MRCCLIQGDHLRWWHAFLGITACRFSTGPRVAVKACSPMASSSIAMGEQPIKIRKDQAGRASTSFAEALQDDHRYPWLLLPYHLEACHHDQRQTGRLLE